MMTNDPWGFSSRSMSCFVHFLGPEFEPIERADFPEDPFMPLII